MLVWKKFQAKLADVRRGWAKACCKSHAAHAREKKLDRFGFNRGKGGGFHSSIYDLHERDDFQDVGDFDGHWDAHKECMPDR